MASGTCPTTVGAAVSPHGTFNSSTVATVTQIPLTPKENPNTVTVTGGTGAENHSETEPLADDLSSDPDDEPDTNEPFADNDWGEL